MERFTTLSSRLVRLPVDNIDTDQVIPARFLKVTDKVGLGQKLFYDWRYLENGADNPSFVLNQPGSKGAQVLVAGDNFGCGSSREHAPWALLDWGFRAVIATSFADIFRNNALKNGLLPVQVDPAVHSRLLEATADAEIRIDLGGELLTLPDGATAKFEIEPFARRCMLNGQDQLDYLVSKMPAIENYEQRRNHP
ncbi:MAG: 3-isopropylmalate dehydratase small subunit [Myxococcota bacterium]